MGFSQTGPHPERMELRIIIIGIGFMGQMHARVYRALAATGRAVKVVGVVDSFPGANEAMERLNLAVPRFSSLNEALQALPCDAVDICLPTDLHLEHLRAAARAGKHVFCEKPLALDQKEAEAALAEAEGCGITLQIGHCIRFWPEYQALQRFAEAKQGGRLLRLSLTRRASRPLYSRDNWLHDEARSKGAALDLHIHDTDFALHLLGTPRGVHSVGRKEGKAWSYLSTHYLYDGVMVTAEGGWDLPGQWGFQMAFQAVFENASVDYDSLQAPTLRLTLGDEPSRPLPFPQPEIGDDNGSGGNISALGGYYNELAYFCDCLIAGCKTEIATGRQGLESLHVVLAEIESAEKGAPVLL